MSAVVIALDTPYYKITDQRGDTVIPNVPPGRYVLHVWHQASRPDALNSLTRQIWFLYRPRPLASFDSLQ